MKLSHALVLVLLAVGLVACTPSMTRKSELEYSHRDFRAATDLNESGLVIMPLLFDDEESSWDGYRENVPDLVVGRLDSMLHRFGPQLRLVLPDAAQALIREAALGRPGFMATPTEWAAIDEAEANDLYQALGTRYLLRTRFRAKRFVDHGHADPSTGLRSPGADRYHGYLYGEIFDLTSGALVWRGNSSSWMGESILSRDVFRDVMLAAADALIEELYGIPR